MTVLALIGAVTPQQEEIFWLSSGQLGREEYEQIAGNSFLLKNKVEKVELK
ncbi:hypothetical protein [Chryseobacterium panacisoli]|uniref:hypothetical protein n=1 Tax=Chryseobacterium panacisoli TaxID=1807141 RepID=UPI00155AF730|nr:hypothetical protein [Chryseobacterium panacisoli]